MIIGGDWNFVQNKDLDSFGCKQPPKLRSIAELAKISETHQLSNIFRIRYPNEKRYTFRATRPLRKTRLDYFLVSNTFHEAIDKCTILNFVSSDHNHKCISIGGIKHSNGAYADDLGVIGASITELNNILNHLKINSAEFGLNINLSKTKVMLIWIEQ